MTQSFDEYFKENYNGNLSEFNRLLIQEAFEAGAQSRQAEVDELQDEIQGYKRIYGELELKRDELQARVDEALEILEYNEYTDSYLQALEILKGNKDEN